MSSVTSGSSPSSPETVSYQSVQNINGKNNSAEPSLLSQLRSAGNCAHTLHLGPGPSSGVAGDSTSR